MSETGSAPAAVNPPPWGPDYRLEAISLAVELYAGQGADERTVLHTADEFYARLTFNRTVPPGVAGEILAALGTIDRKLETMSDQQAELNTDIATLTAVVTDVSAQTATLGTDLTAVVAEIADLEAKVAAGQPVDLSGLTELVAAAQGSQTALDAAVTTATGLVPAPPAPPVTPTP